MDVLDLGAFLLNQNGKMSAMKLQKSAYYSQAWCLALLGRPLTREDVQAWAQGPVIYELFARHKGLFVVSDLGGDFTALTADGKAYNLVSQVLAHYGSYDGIELSEMTHHEPPWMDARRGLPHGQPSRHLITHDAIRDYYGRISPPWPLR